MDLSAEAVSETKQNASIVKNVKLNYYKQGGHSYGPFTNLFPQYFTTSC